MRKFLLLIALVAIFAISLPAFANHVGNSDVCGVGSHDPCGDGESPPDDDDNNGNHGGNGGHGHGGHGGDAEQAQGQAQGQQQGQLQGQAQGQSSSNVNVDDSDVTVEGDSTHYDAARIPTNSAAPVFAGACAQGVSAQGIGFGASIGSGNPVCDYVAVAGALVAAGERELALGVLAKAEKAADTRSLLARIRGYLTLGLL